MISSFTPLNVSARDSSGASAGSSKPQFIGSAPGKTGPAFCAITHYDYIVEPFTQETAEHPGRYCKTIGEANATRQIAEFERKKEPVQESPGTFSATS
jgi:hypothetical protein